jgi:hypothetical protein
MFFNCRKKFLTSEMSVSIPTAPSHHVRLSQLLFFHRLIKDKNIGKKSACRKKIPPNVS